jgi:Transposase
VRSYCRSFAVSNAHSDRTDAAMIARYTFHYHGELRALERASGPMRHLRSLVEHRRTLVDERTVLTNRLQALLKLYFPQALKLLSEDLWRPMNCEFLLRWPSLQALRRARFSTLDAFWAAHGSRSEKRLRERLDLLAGVSALTEDADTITPLVLRVESLARQLQVLVCQSFWSRDAAAVAIGVRRCRLPEAAGLLLEQPDGGVSQAGAHSRNSAACPCVAPSTTTIHTTALEMWKRVPSFAIRTPW